jgi:hypothetical protein
MSAVAKQFSRRHDGRYLESAERVLANNVRGKEWTVNRRNNSPAVRESAPMPVKEDGRNKGCERTCLRMGMMLRMFGEIGNDIY